MTRQWYALIGIVIAGLTLTGCATIMNQNHQDLAIVSQSGPSCVSIDGQRIGLTPLVTPLTRGQVHVVRVEQEGHLPYETSVVPVTSPWVFGNFFFGGLIGLAIDALTGSMYDLSHQQITAILPVMPQLQASSVGLPGCDGAKPIVIQKPKRPPSSDPLQRMGA